MKKKILRPLLPLLLGFTLFAGCSKEDEGGEDCRVCKAFATSTQPTVEETVCSDTELQDFRSRHPGREISCN